MFEKKRETPERLYYMRILGLCNWTIKSSLHDFTLPRCPDTPTDHIMLYHIISPAYVYEFFASCHNSTYTSTSYYLKNPPERAVSAIKLDRSGSIFKPGMICVKCWRAKKPRPFRPQRTLRVNEYEIRPIHLLKQQINRENVNRVDVVKKKKKKDYMRKCTVYCALQQNQLTFHRPTLLWLALPSSGSRLHLNL